MKKIAVSSLVSLFILSCSVSAPNNSSHSLLTPLLGGVGVGSTHYSPIKEDFTALAKKYNFAELEKEYKSFSTKALSDAYVKRMFGKYLSGTVNSLQLTRQLEFSRYLKNNGDNSYETSLKSIFSQTPALYNTLTDITYISNKMSTESATFGHFVQGLNPAPGEPVATFATNVTATSFTANWDSVSGATSYKLFINGVQEYYGSNLSFNKTGLVSGTTHTFSVQAIKSGLASNNSNEISVSLFTKLTQIQSISTSGAHNFEFFNIGTDYYIAVANFNSSPSVIYKWNSVSKQFVNFQSISSLGATNFKHFIIGGNHYLAVSNYMNVGYATNQNSQIYKWNGTQFETTTPFQSVATRGGRNWEYFDIGTDHFLSVANLCGDLATNCNFNIDSKIYKWNGSGFNTVTAFQSVTAEGARKWKYFDIGTDHYLALGNYKNSSTYNVNSKIFKWNGTQFDISTPFQNIPTHGVQGLDFFSIGTNHYLAVANYSNDLSEDINSPIYKWNGSQFDISTPFQNILTHAAFDVKYFAIGSDHYLAIANFKSGSASKVYKWNYSLSKFDEFATVTTSQGVDVGHFIIDDIHYLAFSDYGSSTSKIYKVE